MQKKNLLQAEKSKKSHVIVIGNEKGGSGKSTIAMHLAIGLLRLGFKVGTVDVDSHQGTFTSYMKNRWDCIRRTGKNLPTPEHIHIDRAEGEKVAFNRDQERWRVETVVQELSEKNDFIIIDTPGSDRYMNIVGHSLADTIITPMNDSYLDLDLIAKVDPHTDKILKVGVYTKMVWDIKRRREEEKGDIVRWFVMRNRLSEGAGSAHSKVAQILDNLQWPIGYKIAPSLSERSIYRELFLRGLTLLDIKEGQEKALSMANLSARQEIRHLVRAILPQKEVSTLSLLKTN